MKTLLMVSVALSTPTFVIQNVAAPFSSFVAAMASILAAVVAKSRCDGGRGHVFSSSAPMARPPTNANATVATRKLRMTALLATAEAGGRVGEFGHSIKPQ